MDSVQIRKGMVEMVDYSQDPLNPHAPFPQWGGHAVYPYQFWGSMERRPVRKRYYMPTIENAYLRISVAADIGGRIWEYYDKVEKRHLANFSTGVRTYNAGFGLNYTSGGIECNYPLAHSVTTSRKREVTTRRNADGSASIVISEYERIWRTRWSVTYTLYPGRSFVELAVRIYNRTPMDSRYMYWNNCGFFLNDSTQFIVPEEAGALHGMERQTFSWPIWRNLDLSMFRNNPEQIGLYMLDARGPFFGYYDHGEGYGLVHYGDLADLPGKKTWTWGKRYQANVQRTHHSDGRAYGEVQSGRIVIQEHLDRMPPETECAWREIWYPVREVGAFNGAGPGAVMRAEVVERTGGRTRIEVCANGNGSFPSASAVVRTGEGRTAKQRLALAPDKAVKRTLTVEGKAGPGTVVEIRDRDGAVLARARLEAPNERDSWREAVDYATEVKAVGAEELFMEGERQARDWGNHDLAPLYEKAIRLDDGYAPARRELGKIATWKGLYEEAIGHFRVALERDGDSLATRYFMGVALGYAGQGDEARKMFELACRYDFEARARVRLAEIAMREEDWHEALSHLDRLAEAHPRLTRGRFLRAACLRKIGRVGEARKEIAQARVVDAEDPFGQMEAMFLARSGKKKAIDALLAQVRGEEPALLEAAFDYISVGLYEEALETVGIIPTPGPLALFTRAWLLAKSGKEARAEKVIAQGCKANPTGQLAWRLEMMEILEWARGKKPKEGRLAFHLGNLLMGRRRTEEGVGLWREAERLGEKHYLLFANLGLYEKKLAKDEGQAASYFRKAAEAEGGDLYVKHELFQALTQSGKEGEALRYLEGERRATKRSPLLAHDLLSAYLGRSNYRKFDAFCASGIDFSVNYQIAGPQSLWLRRYMQEALELAEKGKHAAALRILEGMREAPTRLGMHGYRPERDVQRLYHMGRMREKLGDTEGAHAAWEEAIALRHHTGYEPAYWYSEWNNRYFQALSMLRLGREPEANTLFDGMELLAKAEELPLSARQAVLDLVHRGRFAGEDEKDPFKLPKVTVAKRAED